jgi:hypothetical protein
MLIFQVPLKFPVAQSGGESDTNVVLSTVDTLFFRFFTLCGKTAVVVGIQTKKTETHTTKTIICFFIL